MRPSGLGRTRLVFLCPSRGLIGYHGLFLTDTRGTGVMYRLFHGYGDYRGPIEGRRNGVLISNTGGTAVPYALWNLEERGAIMIDPGDDIYVGMIIGEHSRGNDLDVNPGKTKQLTNIRAAMKDDNVKLTPPKKLSLEQALAYIDDDELVEVTPNHIRLRKRYSGSARTEEGGAGELDSLHRHCEEAEGRRGNPRRLDRHGRFAASR